MNHHRKRVGLYPQIRYFACTVCGSRTPATKWKGKTVAGHVKTMCCYRCRKITDQIQQHQSRNRDNFYKEERKT